MLSYTEKEGKIYNKFNIPKKQAINVLVNDKKIDNRAIIGSLVGVSAGFMASVILSQKSKAKTDIFIKNDFKKSAKNLLKATKINYEGAKGWLYMMLQAGGATFGSLIAANTKDKDKENRIEKLKEAIFVMNNVALPALFAKTTEHIITNSKLTKNDIINRIGKNKISKNIAVFASLFVGLAVSLKITNEVNTKIIEPDDKKKKKLNPADMLVHVDDILPVLISSKGSIFQKLPFDFLMPFIYFILGSKVGKKTYYENE